MLNKEQSIRFPPFSVYNYTPPLLYNDSQQDKACAVNTEAIESSFQISISQPSHIDVWETSRRVRVSRAGGWAVSGERKPDKENKKIGQKSFRAFVRLTLDSDVTVKQGKVFRIGYMFSSDDTCTRR